MVYCVVPVTPSTDPQRSSVHINDIETGTAINYRISQYIRRTVIFLLEILEKK